MIFCMLCLLCHTNLPAKNEQNLPCGSRDNHLATAVATKPQTESLEDVIMGSIFGAKFKGADVAVIAEIGIDFSV